MNTRLIIIGASGHGEVAFDIAYKMDLWTEILFLDDNIDSASKFLESKIVGKVCDAEVYKYDSDYFVAIGNSNVREKIQENLLLEGFSIVSLIHPKAIIGTNVKIGMGTIVMAGVVINSGTVIGDGCIINTSSSIDHDNQISDYVHISPGVNLAGTVVLGDKVWVGIGASIINNITICDNCIIGAGAVVVNNINKPSIYFGVPAREK